MRRLVTLAAILAACSTDGTGPGSPPTRPFRMGFSAMPPKLDQAVAVQAIQLWIERADIAIVHEELPWTDLVAGVPPDSILAREKDGLIGFFRAKGLSLVFIADPDDGLSRGEDAPRLRQLGRSLTEPAIQRLFRDYVVAFVRRYHPEYVGLAAETNLIRVLAPAPLYGAVVAVANAAAADLAGVSPRPVRFVSVQVETAWGKLPAGGYRGVEQDFADFPFAEALGLSSYPYFVWADPADLPADYYRRLLGGRTLPVLVVEGGWASGSFPGVATSPAAQARYLARQSELLTAAGAIGWLQLAPTDFDLPSFPADVRAQIAPFSTLGVVDAQLAAKPALAVWDSVFRLPRR